MDLRRTTASEELFRVLREQIVSGRYAPGEKLPPQRTLAAEYGLNATTVREAIKRLEQLRLVDVRHGDAMRVADWRTASGLDVLAHVLLDADTLRSLMEARRFLLTSAAALAAERRTDEQADELRALAHVAASEQTADFTFFAGLVEASGNVVFSLILNSVRPIYFEHAPLFAGLITPDQAAMYARAAHAVTARDPEAAAAAVTELALRQEQALEESRGSSG